MVTFVQATYALVKFVEMRNISAVTGPTLTKLKGKVKAVSRQC